ncbi:hypothetical protein K458DRAFT_442906 [Lentithecium fluviatile CBS 122367]|uniref:DUF6697 domain-containing protein n=1 Tax=Lentithecium fluviatile CBS 122367 TaxID=1168545 RepID=A0A6G1J241_9PLEO|nr:hypothetical protein K458DRAFT_442906 [Lentithecium fluviatile CBS 122367]
MPQVSQSSNDHLECKVHDIECEQGALRTDIQGLRTLCDDLQSSIEELKKGGWDVKVGPFKDQTAADIRGELDALSAEAKGDNDGGSDTKTNASMPPHMHAPSNASSGSSSIPPHLRGKNGAENKNSSLPPHLRKPGANRTTVKIPTAANSPLVTDGIVDTTSKTHGPEPTPPASPSSTIRPDNPIPSVENIAPNPATDKTWTPSYLNTIPPLTPNISDKIQKLDKMASFAPDFLRNTFGGIQWAPGLNFVPPGTICLIRNRVYYTLDLQYEPYLPSKPGGHGAKLLPFFNENPEEHYDLDPELGSSTENVPLFVLRKDSRGRSRYFYFGHYSQTRWSDKLDYDRMVQCVPPKVREYWAEELSSAGRPDWVTDALLKHFFPKPEYDGRMFGFSIDEGGSVVSEDLPKREEKVFKDVKKYVEALKEWEKESKMKTAMIKKEFILQAFDRADADEPPALRLWWEYLECIDWRAGFYDLLITLQARDPNYERY